MSVGSSPAPETIRKFSVNGSIMVSKTTGLGSNPGTCAKYLLNYEVKYYEF